MRILLLYSLLFSSCNFIDNQADVDSTYNRNIVPYDLLNPTATIRLPNTLEEISGLSWYEDFLIAVDDEKGEVYRLSSDGMIIDEIDFNDDGDYEGLEYAEGYIWVIKSNGNLYRVDPSSGKDEKLETKLSHRNNVEGLAYHNGILILACKEDAGLDDDIMGRALYGYDVKSHEFLEDPLVVITSDQFQQVLEARSAGYEIFEFAPSGVAVHPQSKLIYVLSHRGTVMAVLNEDYQVKEVIKLSSRTFKQPEGIAFSPEGRLYISNEGRGGAANILIFNHD